VVGEAVKRSFEQTLANMESSTEGKTPEAALSTLVTPPPPAPKTKIEALADRKAAYEISWPNVVRIDHEYRPQLTLDPSKTKLLLLDAYETPTLAELAPMIDGKSARTPSR